jgi:hypothetical protein
MTALRPADGSLPRPPNWRTQRPSDAARRIAAAPHVGLEIGGNDEHAGEVGASAAIGGRPCVRRPAVSAQIATAPMAGEMHQRIAVAGLEHARLGGGRSRPGSRATETRQMMLGRRRWIRRREDKCSEMEVRPDAGRRADDQRHGMRAGQVDERLQPRIALGEGHRRPRDRARSR